LVALQALMALRVDIMERYYTVIQTLGGVESDLVDAQPSPSDPCSLERIDVGIAPNPPVC
jgi:hypothetical protein